MTQIFGQTPTQPRSLHFMVQPDEQPAATDAQQSNTQPPNPQQPNPQSSAYSFEQGTFQEVRSRYESATSTWILGIFIALMTVLGLYAALTAGLKVWELQRRAALFETGTTLKQLSFEAWQQILPATGLTALPFIIAIVSSLVTCFGVTIFARYQPAKRLVWVARYQSKIIGWALLVPKANYTILAVVYIDPEHRHQRVGSHLLWNCLRQMSRPVYLICYPHLQSFYHQLGFTPVAKPDLPRELKRSLLRGMGLFQAPKPPPPLLTPFPFTSGMTACFVSNWWTILQIYRAFWRRQRFRYSRRYVLILVALLIVLPFQLAQTLVWSLSSILGLTSLSNFNVSLLGIQVSALAIALWLIIALFCFVSIFGKWQEWVVYDGDRPIAYIHISVRSTCSILYHLQIEPQYPPHTTANHLLTYLKRKIQFPLYFACPQRDRRFYAELGFTTVDRSVFPLEMKILQLGRSVPLKLTDEKATELSLL
jgi:N-acetylglutamate synthase-like GNAT family acetyltransferase